MAETGTNDGEVLTGRLPVILFPTCLGDLMSPQTVVDARRVLEACRCDVSSARGTTCCGQPYDGRKQGQSDCAGRHGHDAHPWHLFGQHSVVMGVHGFSLGYC